MTGISITPHELPSVYRITQITLIKLIEQFMEIISSAVNHPDPTPYFEEV